MTEHPLRELFEDYRLEAYERLDRVEQILLGLVDNDTDDPAPHLIEVRRELHTIKGNSGMMGFGDLLALAHDLEDRVLDTEIDGFDDLLAGLDRFRALLADLEAGGSTRRDDEVRAVPSTAATAPDEGSIRVPVARLNSLVELMTELVVSRHRLGERLTHNRALALAQGSDQTEVDAAWRQTVEALGQQEKTLDQQRILGLRMVPLRSLVRQLRRIVRQEGDRLGKEVELTVGGETTPLDKALTETVAEALGHLVRNAVVHGIEDPMTRKRAGKPRLGTIHMEAAVRSGHVWIDVIDDGAGVDVARLREIADRRALELSEDADLHSLLFHPGLSTRETADQAAGRGMGLSSALEAVYSLGGTIDAITAPTVGTRFQLRLPLSLAITDALLLTADTAEYALPVRAVVETVALPPGARKVVEWRERSVELIDLATFFDPAAAPADRSYAVIFEAEGKLRGLAVDQPGRLQEIVVKGLDEIFGRLPGIAGTTILGDGRVLMILDPPSLITSARRGSEAA